MAGIRRGGGLVVALALVSGALATTPAAAIEEATPPPSAATSPGSIGAVAPEAADGAASVAQAPTLPTGFADVEVIGDITEATSVDFAADGTAFVALKTGVIKSFDYDAASDTFEPATQATNFADLSVPVNNYHDRGLTGIAVDPQFPSRPYVYASYTYNRDPRDDPPEVPRWGPPGQQYDTCPDPATTDPPTAGCVVMMRVVRLTAERPDALGWVMVPGSERELMASGCFQFGSHASGDVVFGPDGKLYASAGDGASFDTLDHGQYANPCADPIDEGGSLRSQDYRSAGDPLGVDGAVVRMDPDTGFTPSQGTAAQWLVAYGQRNPWRLTFRPDTFELWSGDVGASEWEEVNRIGDVRTQSGPVNRGWPCYEGSYTGSQVQPGWDALDLPLCESLYAEGPGAVAAPYFSYQTRGPVLTPGEDCLNDTSSVSGVAFGATDSGYPARYHDAMFFSDYARSCVWVLGKKPNGDPDPTVIEPFVQAAETPVDLITGPGGDLYYVDYGLTPDYQVGEGEAGVHRIVYTGSNATPTARISAAPTSGPAPLLVDFDGTGSTDPDGDPLTYSWDLDGDGSYETSGPTPSHSYDVGTHTATLRVDDGHGHTSTATTQIQAGNSPPTLGSVTPSPSLTWAVGQTIDFSATATDPQEGTLPPSAFGWAISIRHCPTGVCHTHPFQSFPATAAGSFVTPDHEYPSSLLLTVTVTDGGGLTDSRTVQLDPRSVGLRFASLPGGAGVTVNGATHTTPHDETFIQGSRLTVTAAPTTGAGSAVAAFDSWSDGLARSHELSAPTSPTTYTATYTRPTAALSADPTSGPAPLTVTYTAGATNAGGVSGGFTFAWDLDDDGEFDDGTGTSQARTYPVEGSPRVRVLATDSRGATDAKAVTVTVEPPVNHDPTAAISADPTSGPAPLLVSFSAAGSSDPDGDPLTYAWDLDDDGSYDDASGPTSSRSYSGVGPKTVRVRVADGRGGSDTAEVTVTVTNRAPVAAVTANPTSGQAPLPVTFDAGGSSDPDGSGLSYAWDLDDDGEFDDATGVSAQRTFSALGDHTATVRVTDADGGTATAQTTVTVTNTGPTAQITTVPAPATGNAPLQVSFDASSSSDPDGGELAYAWDLDGDGAFDDATGPTAQRTYQVGTVTVGLLVTDDQGASSTASVAVLVPNRDPVAAIRADPASGPAPLAVGLSAAGSSDPDGTALSYAWDLDDDGAFDDATGETTSRTFSEVGPHRVAVQVTDADGGTATRSTTVTVTNTGPQAVIVTDPAPPIGTAPLSVLFDGASSTDPEGEPLGYAWDLDGDGQYDDGNAPTASGVYQPGVVEVRLKVTDPHGDSGTTSATVTAVNTAPTVTRVSSYPAGGFAVGQTLGFDAAATDPQQDLPDSAYSFRVLRQDCESGCPRVEVQRWDGVRSGQFQVPDLPYPSHLYLVVVATDDQGATGTRELRLDPRPATLTVRAKRKLRVKVDGIAHRGRRSVTLVAGTTLRLVAPRRQVRKGVRWRFVRWSDGGRRRHDVTVWDARMRVRAIYRRVR